MELNEFQQKLYDYIKEGRYVDVRGTANDLGVSKSKVFNHLQLLIASGLVEEQSGYRAK